MDIRIPSCQIIVKSIAQILRKNFFLDILSLFMYLRYNLFWTTCAKLILLFTKTKYNILSASHYHKTKNTIARDSICRQFTIDNYSRQLWNVQQKFTFPEIISNIINIKITILDPIQNPEEHLMKLIKHRSGFP